ncbi:glycerol-3-phosphate dehydrogenase [Azorhizobium oxalatiphilum]|uniref:Glycerol-3-phosphate dehydrogenase n=1 Tax=Azorhizobium oxalatiphilum TaxID=980631 RepID=A0A917FFK5_9HYPH|nr:glycerol-3-phosphate dehydrogenase [Azorhizobium oxalatiphilum]GGF71100.1 glycerol-3-phosphate dehydrogenase [Azorhizobium oxalatiphilum]
MQSPFDILVVGGGINGAGIARDAVGRGLSVLLVEQDDLAAHTSSWSTKLIHGGLRYLEYYEFRLVREALLERERLLEMAPHIIRPLRFVLPHDVSVRPAWLVRLGLFFYDHLASRKRLPGCERVNLAKDKRGAPLKPITKVGFEYSDCAVDDSRLVVLNALDAKERGADIEVGTRLESARREGDLWVATLVDAGGERREVKTRILVNAAGPWVADVLNHRLSLNTSKGVRLVKGSHIVVPRLYPGTQAYILQNPDKRIVFAIPYQDDLTLIGTTDVPYTGAPQDVSISDDETDYLISSINHWFQREISKDDIVWDYSGVRPLFDDGSINASAVTRDYVFDIDAPKGQAPLLSVFGGKLTTYRKLAEHVMRDLAPHLPRLAPAWTADAPLPGGDIADGDVAAYADKLLKDKPFIGRDRALRLARTYGTRAEMIVGTATKVEDLGRDFGAGLTAAELTYLKIEEWARTGRDVLWRRTKLGLKLPKEAEQEIDAFLKGA